MKSHVALVLSFISVLLIVNNVGGQGQVYCGRRLAETLAYLCENPLINRPSDGLLLKRTNAYHAGLSEDFPWPWIGPHQARRMSKRQVVSECCDKPCTMNELLAYCDN